MKNNALSYPITLCRKIRDSYQKSNVNVMNCIGYTFIILLIHLLTYGISWKAIYIINKVTDYIPSYTSYINAITNAGQRSLSASILIFIPFLLGIPLVLT